MAPSTSTKEPDFSHPIELLRANHERTRVKCTALRQLVSHLKEHGCDEKARQMAVKVARYFDTAAHDLHEDVELDLLPRMMAAASKGRGSPLTRLVADVTNEHRALERAWTELRAALQALAAGDRTSLDFLAVDRFVKLYQSHIAIANANVFPLAEMLLTREDLATIGANMAARRDVSGRPH